LDKTPITINGSEKLKEELKLLKSVERPEVIQPLQRLELKEIFLKTQNMMLQKKNKDSLREELLILKQSYQIVLSLIQKNFKRMAGVYLEQLLSFKTLILKVRLHIRLLGMMKQI